MNRITRTAALGAALLALGAGSAAAAPSVGGIKAAPIGTGPGIPGPGELAASSNGPSIPGPGDIVDGKGSAKPGPKGIASASGCAAQCITSAVVTPTSTSAKVEVTTTVPTSVSVTASPVGEDLFEAGGAPHVSVPALAKSRIVQLVGLKPGTTYAIAVKATDGKGQTHAESGEFATKEVSSNDLDGPDGLADGIGCAADCITLGTATNHPSIPGRTQIDVETSVPAKIEVIVKRTSDGQVEWQKTIQSVAGVTSFGATLKELHFGRGHEVIVSATDGHGTHVEEGTFSTASVSAEVDLYRLQILDDGDAGANKGELFFDYLVDGQKDGAHEFRKHGTGDTFRPYGFGASRGGVTFTTSANDNAPIDMAVRATECDAVLMKNCVAEAVGSWNVPGENPPWATGGGNGFAWATGSWTPEELLDPPNALPPWHGAGVAQPAGRDAYVQFQRTGFEVEHRVLATVDFEVEG